LYRISNGVRYSGMLLGAVIYTIVYYIIVLRDVAAPFGTRIKCPQISAKTGI